MNEKWTLWNVANHGMRYGKFDSMEDAVQAAKEKGEFVRVDEGAKIVVFLGEVRL